MSAIDNNLLEVKDIVQKCLEDGLWSWENYSTISLDGTNITLKIIE